MVDLAAEVAVVPVVAQAVGVAEAMVASVVATMVAALGVVEVGGAEAGRPSGRESDSLSNSARSSAKHLLSFNALTSVIALAAVGDRGIQYSNVIWRYPLSPRQYESAPLRKRHVRGSLLFRLSTSRYY